ncbi:MAG: metallophosphoesterase [Xanthomonadales bacterium]|nr:metallophosphoesterase [Xanthomonadales bacterium]
MRAFLSAYRSIMLLLLLAAGPAAGAEATEDWQWTGVERVVAMGDIHGDYDHYMQVLREAGLVDKRDNWSAGATHLVQTGDVPDRGPDTRKIMAHLAQLKKQARRDGGRVHTLLGNHEAMNIYGDLRYVTPGEYAAFQGRKSRRLQQAQIQHYRSLVEARDPDAFAGMDEETLEADLKQRFPLGWVEYREAWLPEGEVGSAVLENPAVIKINDTLFVHGGLSAKYCQLSLAELTAQIHAELENYNAAAPGMIEDPYGPLWYRGLASDDEDLRAPMLEAILARYDAARIVIGHTPTQGVVWPRFDARVVLNDLGMAEYYGGHIGWLELTAQGAVAHYAEGRSLPLPANEGRIDYLQQVVDWHPDNRYLKALLQSLKAPAETPASAASAEDEATAAREAVWLNPDNCR